MRNFDVGMQFAIDECYLPATVTAAPMTDEEFTAFCSGYPDYFIEMTAEGEIEIMPSNFSLTGSRHAEINWQLKQWARLHREGLVTDAAAGFRLPNGARRSPDVAWTSKQRVRSQQGAGERGYWHLAPDFVIELRSQTDRLPKLRAKMREWIENGCHMAWLIDPERRAVEVYRPGHEAKILTDPVSVTGEGPVGGFLLELRLVWNPLSE